MSGEREKFVRSLRTGVVFLTAGFGTFFWSLLTILLLRTSSAKGEDVISLAATLLGCIIVGGILIGLLCLAAFHVFSFWRSTSLKKAIRLVEAMHMLKVQTHKERLEAIRHHSLRIFKASIELPPGVSEDVRCKEISTFLSPMFYQQDRLNAIGSPYYCCDFEQLQQVIASCQEKWGLLGEQPGEESTEVAALERALAEAREKYKKKTGECSGAVAREGILKKQLAETESHMAILITLANEVTNKFKPPRSITQDEVKAKYIAIGKIYGITKAPVKYVELFRKNMPKDVINQGGAPNQGQL